MKIKWVEKVRSRAKPNDTTLPIALPAVSLSLDRWKRCLRAVRKITEKSVQPWHSGSSRITGVGGGWFEVLLLKANACLNMAAEEPKHPKLIIMCSLPLAMRLDW